jgi:hypothetical protein
MKNIFHPNVKIVKITYDLNHFQAYQLKSLNTLKKMVDKAQKRVGEPSVDSVLMLF